MFYNFFKHAAWTEPDLLDRLMQEYILVFKAKNEAERLKPQMSVDIVVQVLFLDKHYEGNEAIQAEWLKFRQECLFKVEKMVDEDEDYAKDYGTLYNVSYFDELYKYKKLKNEFMESWQNAKIEWYKKSPKIVFYWQSYGQKWPKNKISWI